jgi:hypothetical protein
MIELGGFRNLKDMIQTAQTKRGIPDQILQKVEENLAGCKIKLIHLGQYRKFKSFNVPANSDQSCFEVDDIGVMTVEKYYSMKAKTDGNYAEKLVNGQLRFPDLPTINIGSKNKKVLVPIELITIPSGQTRQRGITGDVSAKIIKNAAMKPNDRMEFIMNSNNDSLLRQIIEDPNAQKFGVNNIDVNPIKLYSTILSPAKLQYGNNKIITPELTGKWNLAGGTQFAFPAPNNSNRYPYCLIVYHDDHSRNSNYRGKVQDFISDLDKESKIVGIPMQLIGEEVEVTHREQLKGAVERLNSYKPRIIIAILGNEHLYGSLKVQCDRLLIPSQCCRMDRIFKSGYCTNLLMKINMKMGVLLLC